jgi:hypothetical protein
MYDAADHAPVVHPLLAAHVGRQMRLDPTPLFVAQPKEIPAHDPILSEKESVSYCLTRKINEF